jgi:hypothetical protein
MALDANPSTIGTSENGTPSKGSNFLGVQVLATHPTTTIGLEHHLISGAQPGQNAPADRVVVRSGRRTCSVAFSRYAISATDRETSSSTIRITVSRFRALSGDGGTTRHYEFALTAKPRVPGWANY